MAGGGEPGLSNRPPKDEQSPGRRAPATRRCSRANGTFSAKALGIEPQAVNVGSSSKIIFPGGPRVYSPAYTLYVLNAEQHAIWLDRAAQQVASPSLEVRDRELQLFETNKQLRRLAPESSTAPRRAGESKTRPPPSTPTAGACRTWWSAAKTYQQAMRNPEFGVGHLEKWAEMLQILKDISANRMPSVADLLKQACPGAPWPQTPQRSKTPMAGMVRDTRSGAKPGEPDPEEGQSAVPQVVNRESSQQSPERMPAESAPSKVCWRRGWRSRDDGRRQERRQGDRARTAQKVDEAVAKQQDLLAEFEKIADELNRVLANLEGSTLLKRLKAASRMQYSISGRMIDLVNRAFGGSTTYADAASAKVIRAWRNKRPRQAMASR